MNMHRFQQNSTFLRAKRPNPSHQALCPYYAQEVLGVSCDWAEGVKSKCHKQKRKQQTNLSQRSRLCHRYTAINEIYDAIKYTCWQAI